jgi:hypothetical protein
MATEEEIRALKRRHSARLLRERGVVGVGIEKDDAGGYALAVHLEGDGPEALGLPTELEGYRLKFVRSGPFKKFPTN